MGIWLSVRLFLVCLQYNRIMCMRKKNRISNNNSTTWHYLVSKFVCDKTRFTFDFDGEYRSHLYEAPIIAVCAIGNFSLFLLCIRNFCARLFCPVRLLHQLNGAQKPKRFVSSSFICRRRQLTYARFELFGWFVWKLRNNTAKAFTHSVGRCCAHFGGPKFVYNAYPNWIVHSQRTFEMTNCICTAIAKSQLNTIQMRNKINNHRKIKKMRKWSDHQLRKLIANCNTPINRHRNDLYRFNSSDRGYLTNAR